MSQDVNGTRVTDAWLRLIQFCATRLPYGEVKVKIQDGSPTDLLEAKASIRFDKPYPVPEGQEILR